MTMSDDQLLEILRAEEAKMIDGGTTLTGFIVTGEQIALAGMRELERHYLTHPEAQGNKDLGEPPLTRLEVTEELRRVVLESASRWDDLATITEEDGPYTNVGFMRASAKRLRDALPPECETDVESELESASNGMGLR